MTTHKRKKTTSLRASPGLAKQSPKNLAEALRRANAVNHLMALLGKAIHHMTHASNRAIASVARSNLAMTDGEAGRS